MLFNSLEYFLFLPIVFSLYWLLRSRLKAQNTLILVASYLFYSFWDYRFLSLIVFSSLLDFTVSNLMDSTDNEKRKRIYLNLSLGINLGILLLFKYFDFFTVEFNTLLSHVGYQASWPTLNLILPVGISFYTFQSLSYTLDVYNEEIEPTKDIISFLAYVSFFPQLVAGPIERATHLLPQFHKQRVFNYAQAVDGLRQILLGLFKKVVIADNLAITVDRIYAQHATLDGWTLMMGAVLFGIQIYTDFAGYSDVAIGSGRLLGFDLSQNFNRPLFSTSITELWRRWHISLSEWFRDYVFTPLTFILRAWKQYAVFVSTLVTFFLIGIWHGPNWTYIVFGLLHGVVLVYEMFTKGIRERIRNKTNSLLYNVVSWGFTFTFWCYAAIYFRSKNIQEAHAYIGNLTSFNTSLNNSFKFITGKEEFYIALISAVFMLGMEYINRNFLHAFARMGSSIIVRYSVYILLILLILEFLNGKKSFIYFQF